MIRSSETFRALRDSHVTLWLKHGSRNAQLPSPPYFEIQSIGLPGAMGKGAGYQGVSISVSTLNYFCHP